MGAKCPICKKDMLKVDGCISKPYRFSDGYPTLEPVKYGEEEYRKDKQDDLVKIGRCGDCGCLPYHYHHHQCDMEECPRCHDQALFCGCPKIR